MANGGGLPPASAYAAAANACARAGQAVRAKALVTELKEGSSRSRSGSGGGNGNNGDVAELPTLDCYNAVVLACAISGDVAEAVRMLREEIPKAGLKPNSETYTHLLRMYATLKDWKAAVALLDEQRSGAYDEGIGLDWMGALKEAPPAHPPPARLGREIEIWRRRAGGRAGGLGTLGVCSVGFIDYTW